MHADQMRLRQALLNLMSNANKFTDKGTVTIDAHQEQENGRDWITLSVADTGIGMTRGADGQAVPGVLPGLLDHREQVRRHGPWPRDQPAFCQMMGGDITVASEPGKGSMFTVRLPGGASS